MYGWYIAKYGVKLQHIIWVCYFQITIWLQHVVGMMQYDTNCCVVIGGKELCVILFQQSIGLLLVAKGTDANCIYFF